MGCNLIDSEFMVQMGAKRLMLEAPCKKFIKQDDFLHLKVQYTLVKSHGVTGLCVKAHPVPSCPG